MCEPDASEHIHQSTALGLAVLAGIMMLSPVLFIVAECPLRNGLSAAFHE